MKKFTAIFLAGSLAFLAACNNPAEVPAETVFTATETTITAGTEAIPETTPAVVTTTTAPETTQTAATTTAPATTTTEATTTRLESVPPVQFTEPSMPQPYETTPKPRLPEETPGSYVKPPQTERPDWKARCYTDEEVYGYNEPIIITFENIGETQFRVPFISLRDSMGRTCIYFNSSVDLPAGQTAMEAVSPQFARWERNITSGDYKLYCQVFVGDMPVDSIVLPIKIDLGDADNLEISHPNDEESFSTYIEEDIPFTLRNERIQDMTVANSFVLEKFDETKRQWVKVGEVAFDGNREIRAYEKTEFVLHYDDIPLEGIWFSGRLAATFTLEDGKVYTAYSLFNCRQCVDDILVAKPVIYLYPKEETDVSVQIDFDGKLTCTYPDYGDGWNVTAYHDGRIINHADGLEYSYLFWEGDSDVEWDMSEGYVVKGADTAKFLRNILSEMGLTPREYNEFIVYWLPKMQNNKYNLITFQQEVYENSAKLKINPTPDSLLRIFMVFRPLDEPIEITAPTIEKFERKGFTVVEWGGTEVK